MTTLMTTTLLTPPPPTPWTSRTRRFQANLTALAPRVPPETITAIRQAATDNLHHYSLHLFPDGNFQIRDTRKPSASSFLGGFQNHKASTHLFTFDKSKTPLPAPLAFDGLSHGHLFLHIASATQNSFLNYSCPLYILESNPLALAFLFHAHDLTQLLPQPRIRLFFNPNREALIHDFRTALLANPTWALPQQFVTCHFEPTPPLPLDESLAAIRKDRESQLTKLKTQIEEHYADKTPAYWHTRYEQATTNRAEPLRILGITSRYTTVLQHSMAEMQAAINSTPTATMQIAIEPDDQSLENPYLQLIADFKPDLIFQISRLRYENPNLPTNVPFLCWDQDNLPCMRNPSALADMKGLTFVAGFGAVYGSAYQHWPLKNCIFCYPTGMTHRYKPAPLAPNDAARFGSDISYISHASGSPEQLRDSLAKAWDSDPSLSPLFHMTSEHVIATTRASKRWNSVAFTHLIQENAAAQQAQLAPELQQELLTHLTTLADRAFRHETLAWVARWCEARGRKFKLWGNGWDKHPAFAKYAAGIAAPGEEAQTIYRASKINLQIIETGALHSRLLDGWASGGFFLIRKTLLPDEEHDAALHWRIAQLTQSEKIESIAALETNGSEELRNLWANIAYENRIFDRHACFAGFKIWQSLPPADELIPGIEQLMFCDEKSFTELADRYLAPGELRTQLLNEIQTALQRNFSYDARWNNFITHIRNNI